jgi:hypothetical protein
VKKFCVTIQPVELHHFWVEADDEKEAKELALLKFHDNEDADDVDICAEEVLEITKV